MVGTFFLGGTLLEGKGEGVGACRHWIFVSFFCAFCLSGCWGALFFVGGGGILLEGKGEGVGACRQGMCCAFFCGFCLSAWWGLFFVGGEGGEEGWGP